MAAVFSAAKSAVSIAAMSLLDRATIWPVPSAFKCAELMATIWSVLKPLAMSAVLMAATCWVVKATIWSVLKAANWFERRAAMALVFKPAMSAVSIGTTYA